MRGEKKARLVVPRGEKARNDRGIVAREINEPVGKYLYRELCRGKFGRRHARTALPPSCSLRRGIASEMEAKGAALALNRRLARCQVASAPFHCVSLRSVPFRSVPFRSVPLRSGLLQLANEPRAPIPVPVYTS